MVNDIIIPIFINISKIKIVGIVLNVVNNMFIDSGIKSVNDTVNITAAAKLKDATMVDSFFLEVNIRIEPNIVDNPAIVVNKKGI